MEKPNAATLILTVTVSLIASLIFDKQLLSSSSAPTTEILGYRINTQEALKQDARLQFKIMCLSASHFFFPPTRDVLQAQKTPSTAVMQTATPLKSLRHKSTLKGRTS